MNTIMNHKIDMVSVVVLSYKNIKNIYDTIDSVLEQTYEVIELIVSDDGTTTFIPEEINRYIINKKLDNLANVLVLKNKVNMGTTKHLNNISKYLSGKYIKLLSSGDRFLEVTSLSKMVKKANSLNCQILVGQAQIMKKGRTVISPSNSDMDVLVKKNDNNEELLFFLLKQNILNINATLIEVNFLKNIFFFDEKYYLLEDWPLWIKACQTKNTFFFWKTPVISYDNTEGVSNTRDTRLMNDILLFYESIIIPLAQNRECLYKREVLFDYCKELARRKGWLDTFLFIISNIDLVIKRLLKRCRK